MRRASEISILPFLGRMRTPSREGHKFLCAALRHDLFKMVQDSYDAEAKLGYCTGWRRVAIESVAHRAILRLHVGLRVYDRLR